MTRAEDTGGTMPIDVREHGTTITGTGIELYRLMALLSALKLEEKGLKLSRGRSALQVAKKQYGLKGNRASIIEQVQAMVDELNPKVPRTYDAASAARAGLELEQAEGEA
jgi:hypothetical protein